MNFNSFEYFIFLALVFLLYWRIKTLRFQNLFVLLVSYFFYGWFSINFLLLIITCSLIDYFLGLCIYHRPKSKKMYLFVSLAMNLGILLFFKYFNFFISNTQQFLHLLNIEISVRLLNILQPIGISFFTFQTMGYNIDIYKGKIKPTKDLLVFLNFSSFFAQIFAGPIERGDQLIPQFSHPRKFNFAMATEGTRQILYGLFKKMVIADKLSINVYYIFLNYKSLPSLDLLLGAIYFYVQIYCDFSGYSDIAIGTGKLLGINLTTNFRTPFFSKTSREAWSRWNITLTTWFRDYVYIPLLYKNKRSTLWRICCTLLLLVLIGFWHGANWTFIIFGLLNGLYFIPHILSKRYPGVRSALNTLKENSLLAGGSMVFLFVLASVTTVFFRSPDLSSGINYLARLFSFKPGHPPVFLLKILPLLIIFLIWEWSQRFESFQFNIGNYRLSTRISLYYLLVFLILLFGVFVDASFIYFRF